MTHDRKRNILVIGLDDWHAEQLGTIRNAEKYRFHPLLDFADVVNPERYDMERQLAKARVQLHAFRGHVDAVIGHWDFPTTTLLPFLAREFALRGAPVSSVMRCEHKFLSRLNQQRVAPASVPVFQAFDPFGSDPWARLDLKPPFWMKPVKAFSSYLGFRVSNEADFRRDIEAVRKGIGLIAGPFNYLLDLADMDNEVAGIDGHHCIAEQIITGHQCTLEGYVQDGEPHVYATIDSFRGINRSSFTRYEYPSVLPRSVKERMKDIAGRHMVEIGYDNAPFNMEFFFERSRDRLWILEVNPRISKSHCPLFELVSGASHHEVAVEVALGIRPRFPTQDGPFRRAAKFMVRRYQDARVTWAPGLDEVAAIESALPGVRIRLHVETGMWLSDLPPQDQDSYSYEVAVIFVGAHTRKEMFGKYRRAIELLGLRYSDKPGMPLPAKRRAAAGPTGAVAGRVPDRARESVARRPRH